MKAPGSEPSVRLGARWRRRFWIIWIVVMSCLGRGTRTERGGRSAPCAKNCPDPEMISHLARMSHLPLRPFPSSRSLAEKFQVPAAVASLASETWLVRVERSRALSLSRSTLLITSHTTRSMASSSVHYRALSFAGLDDSTPSPAPSTSASFLTRRSSFDVKPFPVHRKYSDEPESSDSSLLADARARQVRPLPKNSKCLRVTAYLGWTLALLLFVVLVVGQSSVSPSEHIRSGLAIVREHPLASKLFDDIGFNKLESNAAQKVSHASKPGRTSSSSTTAGTGTKMSGGLKAPVTIVSSFYRIDTGKKHRVSGTPLPLCFLFRFFDKLSAHPPH